MTREEALALVNAHTSEDWLKKHVIATEAVMRALAPRLGGDPDLWGIAGLLHDLDFEATRETPGRHGLETQVILADSGLPKGALDAIARHNAEHLGLTRETPFDIALTCAETVTGMIVAAALVHPEKRLAPLSAESVRKRMKAKEFARKVNREHILLCETAGVPLMEFLALAIDAMKGVSGELGL